MQGYLITEGTDATGVAACMDCVRNGNRSVDGRETVWLGEDFIGTVPCTTCDEVIDGEPVDPKPTSWTITVQVVLYAEPDEIVTESDARDYVLDNIDCYFESVEIDDVLEHF